MSKVCAIILFNHNYEKNLDVLDQIYKPRFSNLFYLMPLYKGNRADVLPIYEDSRYFQGFLQQATGRLPQGDFTHYVVLADDMILNPALNESNIISELGLEADTGFIKGFSALTDIYYLWLHRTNVLNAITNCPPHLKEQLPPAEEARGKMEKHGVHFTNFGKKNLRDWAGNFNWKELYAERAMRRSILGLLRRERPLTYPMVMGYSDFVVIPAASWKNFTHLCGVFAMMRLFVEVALPTALCLTCDNIRTEANLAKGPTTPRCGLEFWTPADVEAFEKKFSLSLQSLLRDFDNKDLYIHPVKLSRWSKDLA
jgi:hypothetical protein